MYPAQPVPPYRAPYGQPPRARSGHPVGAVFVGLCVSVVVSLLYSGLIVLTYKEQSLAASQTLYLVHAVVNAAIVGALVGLMGHRSTGAPLGGAVVAALAAFFGFTNAVPLILAESQSPAAIGDMMQVDPLIPAKAWWNDEINGGVDWVSPLGLVIAAVVAWGLAYAIGRSRGRR
ncbi:hypothetical protein GCM10023220_42570 [Streptomyces ziwulingensis]|uniref:ABC transporter permease n=2 Tax=Streptomyces ziwulingensis TaxID=1045501 RepID=A0ABP9CBV9_9ACTN